LANFIINRYSKEDIHTQWTKYLQQKEFVDDIKSTLIDQTPDYKTIINNQCKQYEKHIQTLSKEQRESVQNSLKAVTSSIESGFSQISNQLFNIDSELSEIGSTLTEISSILDLRLGMLVEEMKINNILTENIALLLRIPDFQKERQYYIEQGLRLFSNASKDDDLYHDALENLLKAEQLEKTDYFVLHSIGLIYLYSTSNLNFKKAEEYFRKSAKYAIVESDPGSAKITNILSGNVSKRLSTQELSSSSISHIASESYFQASVASYLQGNYEDSLKYATKAFDLSSKMYEASFLKSKVLVLLGKENEAADIIVTLIKQIPYYSFKTAIDLDLNSCTKINQMLKDIKKELSQIVSASFKEYEQKVHGLKENISKEDYNKLLKSVESVRLKLQDDTYLNLLYVDNEITKLLKLDGIDQSIIEDIYSLRDQISKEFNKLDKLPIKKTFPHSYKLISEKKILADNNCKDKINLNIAMQSYSNILKDVELARDIYKDWRKGQISRYFYFPGMLLCISFFITHLELPLEFF
jgi:hypothetical protein